MKNGAHHATMYLMLPVADPQWRWSLIVENSKQVHMASVGSPMFNDWASACSDLRHAVSLGHSYLTDAEMAVLLDWFDSYAFSKCVDRSILVYIDQNSDGSSLIKPWHCLPGGSTFIMFPPMQVPNSGSVAGSVPSAKDQSSTTPTISGGQDILDMVPF